MEEKNTQKGTMTEVALIAVSMWAIGQYLGQAVVNAYNQIFLTDIVHMDPTDMGTVSLLSRLLPIFLTPFISTMFQNWQLPYGKKFGKFRTYIATFVPLVGITCVLTFIPMPNLSRWAKFFYYFITSFVYSTLYGLPQTCFQTMMSRVGTATDTKRVTGHRAVFASAASVLYSAVSLPLVNAFGKGDKGKGYLLLMILFESIYIITCMISCIAYKNGDYYPGDVQEKKVETKLSAKQQIKAFLCRPFQVAFWGDLFKNFGYFFFTGATTYYFKVVIKNFDAQTLYLTIMNLSGIFAGFIITPITKKLGLRKSYIVSYGGMALGLILAYFFGENLVGFYIWTIIFRIAYGFTYSVGLLAYSDAADIYMLKTGEDTLPWMMSMYVLPLKLGSALTSGVVGWVLGAAGYDGAAAVQTPTVELWTRLMTTLIPGICCVVAWLLWQFWWPVRDAKEQEEMEAKVAALKAGL